MVMHFNKYFLHRDRQPHFWAIIFHLQCWVLVIEAAFHVTAHTDWSARMSAECWAIAQLSKCAINLNRLWSMLLYYYTFRFFAEHYTYATSQNRNDRREKYTTYPSILWSWACKKRARDVPHNIENREREQRALVWPAVNGLFSCTFAVSSWSTRRAIRFRSRDELATDTEQQSVFLVQRVCADLI